mmetsp:Transcript_7003/g.42960  ORF Transcript_7003/g.42960 Transcript_7003/m.42960 type:complete len:221 (-) Transcript_7003:469-1131(-)
MLHMPSESLEASTDIFSERDISVTIDGDLVIIVQADQFSQAPVTGKGGCLSGDTLHVAAVPKDAVCVVIYNLCIRLVVARSKVLFSSSQSNSHCNSLSERSSGHFDSGGFKVLWVSRSLGSKLAELLHIIDLDGVIPAQMQKGILEHASMSSGEHEPVPVEEVGVFRVHLHDFVVEHVCHGCSTHRQSRMSRLCFFHGIDGQEADRVDALHDGVLVDLRG